MGTGKNICLDTAHNPEALRLALEQLLRKYPAGKIHVFPLSSVKNTSREILQDCQVQITLVENRMHRVFDWTRFKKEKHWNCVISLKEALTDAMTEDNYYNWLFAHVARELSVVKWGNMVSVWIRSMLILVFGFIFAIVVKLCLSMDDVR